MNEGPEGFTDDENKTVEEPEDFLEEEDKVCKCGVGLEKAKDVETPDGKVKLKSPTLGDYVIKNKGARKQWRRQERRAVNREKNDEYLMAMTTASEEAEGSKSKQAVRERPKGTQAVLEDAVANPDKLQEAQMQISSLSSPFHALTNLMDWEV